MGRVKLTNPDKVLYPATGTTKAAVFDYYINVAEAMLPHIAGRPTTRKRWPNGVAEGAFFEKQLASSAPYWLDRGTIAHKSGTIGGSVNDTGIVFLPYNAGHLAVTVLMKDAKASTADRERVIADITRYAYDYFVTTYGKSN